MRQNNYDDDLAPITKSSWYWHINKRTFYITTECNTHFLTIPLKPDVTWLVQRTLMTAKSSDINHSILVILYSNSISCQIRAWATTNLTNKLTISETYDHIHRTQQPPPPHTSHSQGDFIQILTNIRWTNQVKALKSARHWVNAQSIDLALGLSIR